MAAQAKEVAATSTEASVVSRLHRIVDGQRKGLCLAWQVSGNHERGAEFAHRACESKHSP